MRGRKGAAIMSGLLAERRPTDAKCESELETRFLKLLRAHGLPEPKLQFAVKVGERIIARLDFAYDDVKIGMLLDGYGPHSGKRAFEKDREQQNVLVAMGWTLLRFTWRSVQTEERKVADEVRQVLAARRSELATV